MVRVSAKDQPTSQASASGPVSQGVQAAESPKAPVCVIEAGTGTGKRWLIFWPHHLSGIKSESRDCHSYRCLTGTGDPEGYSGIAEWFRTRLFCCACQGRGRYVCLSKLDALLEPNDSLQAMLDLYGEETVDLGEPDARLYQGMLDALAEGSWDGDRDSWNRPIAEQEWRPLTVDNASCLGAPMQTSAMYS